MKEQARHSRWLSQRGLSLLETVIALALLSVTAVGIMSIAAVAVATTEGQGHLAARAAEYAQDKMEQLISLSYGDPSTDTTTFPEGTSGSGLTIGGSSDAANPVSTYVDYLDVSGNQLTVSGNTAPSNWYYVRAWQIDAPSGTSNLKRITVTAQARYPAGGRGMAPKATLVTLKSSPF